MKEETGQSRKKGEQSSKRREDGKEEAISIVGAPDMQVISGLGWGVWGSNMLLLIAACKFLSQAGKQHKSFCHCFLIQLISRYQVENLPISPVLSAGQPQLGFSGTRTGLCLGWLVPVLVKIYCDNNKVLLGPGGQCGENEKTKPGRVFSSHTKLQLG